MADQSLTVIGSISAEDFERAALSLINAKRSENTRKAYRADWETWVEFSSRHGINPINPSLEDSTLFRDHLTEELSKESARRALAALSGIYRILYSTRVAGSNPFHPEVLAWPTGAAINKTKLVSAEVAEAMIDNALNDSDTKRGLRDAAILRLLYDTGLRRASIAALTRSDYSDNANFPEEESTLRAVVKGDKEVEITLPHHTSVALNVWLAIAPPSDFIFPGATKGTALNPLTINKLVGERAKAVGAKGVHPHCFRAAFITACYDAGMPEYDIQASVHHSDSKTTRRYDRGARGKAVATQLSEFRKGKATKS